jgi:Fe2+ transport system protein FeoA
VQRALFAVVALRGQAELHTRLRQVGFHPGDHVRPVRGVGHDPARALVSRHQHELAVRVRCIEHDAVRTVQECRAGTIRQFTQAHQPRPVAQSRSVAGKRQAALDEQSGKLVRRVSIRRLGWRDGEQKDEQKTDYRRSSIWIGPSRRPWVN